MTSEPGSQVEHEVVAKLRACRLVPVVTFEDPAAVVRVARALLAGGLPCIEITFRHPAAVDALLRAREVDGLLVGAGTVLSSEQARAAAGAGAHFAVAPGLNEQVLTTCRELGLPFFPGAATATEIERARGLGSTTVKLFPAAQLGGPGFVRAVSAVYPEMGFIPTGGVTAENATDYLAVSSVVACGGSWLVRPEFVQQGNFEEIEQTARFARVAIA